MSKIAKVKKQLRARHKSKRLLLVIAAASLLAAYSFVNLAMTRGSLIYYILALAALFGFLRYLVELIGAKSNGRR